MRKFGLKNASHKITLAPTHLKLTKIENGANIDQIQYRSIIETDLYLNASLHDIAFVVGVYARYQVNPKG